MNPKWLPTKFTKPLNEHFATSGDVVIGLAEAFMVMPEKGYEKLRLTEWQKWLIRSVLERYPLNHPDPEKQGRLRYKQVVISMPRKQGKTLLGSLFALWGLLAHEDAPEVISVASTADQARLVYKQVLNQIGNSEYLRPRFKKMTEFKGIFTADGDGRYVVIGNRPASAQGLHPSMVIFDELHVSNKDLWTALSLGSATRKDGIVIGITTAGDDGSELLLNLYRNGEYAIDSPEEMERFGFFLWEAPDGCAVNDREAIEQANPNLVEGILSWANVEAEIATMPEVDARRYRLNQFVSASNSWIPFGLWQSLPKGFIDQSQPVTISFDRTPSWDAASVCVAQKQGDMYVTELVAQIVRPDKQKAINLLTDLANKYQATFLLDGLFNNEIIMELRLKGVEVVALGLRDIVAASNMAFSNIVNKKIAHSHDPIITQQINNCVRKNIGDAWKISRKDSISDIDAAMATIVAIWGSDQELKTKPMVH
jgi:phage terminase large subunit-like protein